MLYSFWKIALFLHFDAVSWALQDPLYVPLTENGHSKTIYLVRHGQANHNVDECGKHPDAPLTLRGKLQAQKINCSIPDETSPQLILFSPLRRTVETLLESYGHRCLPAHEGIPCLAMADLQEDWNGEPTFDCDTGSTPAVLHSLFPSLDFSYLTIDWMTADSHLPRHVKTAERHDRVRHWISSRPERSIMIIAHFGTIHGLFNISKEKEKILINNGDTIEIAFDSEIKSFRRDVHFKRHENNFSCGLGVNNI